VAEFSKTELQAFEKLKKEEAAKAKKAANKQNKD
jgi:hypothetical protein